MIDAQSHRISTKRTNIFYKHQNQHQHRRTKNPFKMSSFLSLCLLQLLLIASIAPHMMTTEAIHPITTYCARIRTCHLHAQRRRANRKPKQKQEQLSQSLKPIKSSSSMMAPLSSPMVKTPPPITTTVYVSYNTFGDQDNENLYQSSSRTTSIFTSLGGEDDDNNNNNHNNTPESQPRRSWSELWKTLAWFTFGSLLTVPMTEFILDPLLLTWGMAFLGWLSYEECDHPNQYNCCREDDSHGQEAEEEESEHHYYPGATDRKYFMTREEDQAKEALRQEQERMNKRSSNSYSPPSIRGGNEYVTNNNAGFLKRRSITFCGIQAAMIVLGDWMVRLLGSWMNMGAIKEVKVVPSWLVVFSFPMQVTSIICSMVVHFQIQKHYMGQDDESSTNTDHNPSATVRGSSSSSSNNKSNKHPIPYWLGYYMDHLAILLPIVLLASEFLFESNWLWKVLTKVLNRHVGGSGSHGSFQPLLGRLNEMI